MMKKRRFLFLVLAILLLITAGCSKNQDTGNKNADENVKTEVEENVIKDEKVASDKDESIVLASYRDMMPGELDGYYCSYALYVWEPLVSQDGDGNPIPCLAESWDMSEDGKVWTFNLRRDVKFHNGEDFNADAVIANMDRMKPEVKKSVFYPLDIDNCYPDLESYEKVDDYTVKFTFKNPSPTQLFNMVNWGSAMYAPTNFDENNDFNGVCIGTGPFKIAEHVKDQYVVLERNEDYWGEKAKAKSITVKVIPDADTKYSALMSGEIKGVLDLNAISPANAKTLEDSDDFSVVTAKSTMIRFLIPNGTRFPMNDVRMKQAISLAIDRDEVVNGIHFGYGIPTTNILNYSTPFYKEFPVEHNMEKAKELAKEVLGDEEVEIDFLYNGKDAVIKSECELIQTYLEELGLKVNLVPLEYSAVRERMKAGDFDLARAQQGLSNGEAATIFRRFMLPTGGQNKSYSLGYDVEEVNELMDKASKTLDTEERKEIYNRIQEISTETFPVIPLFNDKTVLAHSNDIDGYDAQLYGLRLPEVHWKEQ